MTVHFLILLVLLSHSRSAVITDSLGTKRAMSVDDFVETVVYCNPGLPKNRASHLDMAEAFRPRCCIQVQSFAESAFVILADTPAFENRVARELVTNAL